MECSVCKKEIKIDEYPECYIRYHRQWKGSEWKPEKTWTWFEFHQIGANESAGTDVRSVLRFCSSKCLEEWCKDIAENGYWRE